MRNTSGSSTVMNNRVVSSGGTSTSSVITVIASPTSPKSVQRVNNKNIIDAVYGHLQAIRALGRTKASISEIAKSLNLPYNQVESALADLYQRGVKPL